VPATLPVVANVVSVQLAFNRKFCCYIQTPHEENIRG